LVVVKITKFYYNIGSSVSFWRSSGFFAIFSGTLGVDNFTNNLAYIERRVTQRGNYKKNSRHVLARKNYIRKNDTKAITKEE